MSAGIRPPLLLLGGQEAYAEYEKEFRIRYQNHFVNDVLGNRILFGRGLIPRSLLRREFPCYCEA